MLTQTESRMFLTTSLAGRSWRKLSAALSVSAAMLFGSATASAQKPQSAPPPTPPSSRSTPASGALVGTLGPAATRALDTQSKGVERRSESDNRQRDNRLFGAGHVPIVVPDAPVYSRGGSTLMVETVSPQVVIGNGWYPTMQPPTWRLVPDEHPVQAWRTVDVDDVLCNANGACVEQTTRVNAKWAATLRAYAFTDRVGRVWLVE